jgi:PTH2 family peptidyl-tRNA hydrolase
MPPGKLAAQAGHAFLEAMQTAHRVAPATAQSYLQDPPGTKVVLAAEDLCALEVAEAWCQLRGIPCARIVDSGHVLPPHFTGDPIVTALGFGPAPRATVRTLTKRFALLT